MVRILPDIENAGQDYDAPSEYFGGKESGHRVDCKGLQDECLENSGTKISYEISDDVHDNDGGCSKLDVESALKAYYQCHCHCEDGQKELIF